MYTNIKDLNVKLPYHGSEVRMIEDVTIVVDSKRISIDSKLQNKKNIIFYEITIVISNCFNLDTYLVRRDELLYLCDGDVCAGHAQQLGDADLRAEAGVSGAETGARGRGQDDTSSPQPRAGRAARAGNEGLHDCW